MNTKQQGDIGVAMAIAYYTKNEFGVSVPLTDNLRYDLVIDDGTKLLKVQVKTTNYLEGKSYRAQLATNGGNQSWSGTIKKLSAIEIDEVFIYAINGTMWRIPSMVLDGFSNTTLGPSKDCYKVTF